MIPKQKRVPMSASYRSAVERARFERAARKEGFNRAGEWMMWHMRKRVREVLGDDQNESDDEVAEIYTRICPECGHEFTSTFGDRTYCSRQCKSARANKVWRSNNRERITIKARRRKRDRQVVRSWAEMRHVQHAVMEKLNERN